MHDRRPPPEGALPLPGLCTGVENGVAQQLVLLGEPRAIRVPERMWRSWLSHPSTVARFEEKRYRRGDQRCWPWLGAVSSTGHGSFRATSLPGRSRRGTVPAHLFAFQLAHGVIPRLGWTQVDDLVLCHQCDFAGCTNPEHMRLGTNAINRAEYAQRRRNVTGPLADVRGAAGRTRAVADAVRAGLAAQDVSAGIERRILLAEAAGQPLTLW